MVTGSSRTGVAAHVVHTDDLKPRARLTTAAGGTPVTPHIWSSHSQFTYAYGPTKDGVTSVWPRVFGAQAPGANAYRTTAEGGTSVARRALRALSVDTHAYLAATGRRTSVGANIFGPRAQSAHVHPAAVQRDTAVASQALATQPQDACAHMTIDDGGTAAAPRSMDPHARGTNGHVAPADGHTAVEPDRVGAHAEGPRGRPTAVINGIASSRGGFQRTLAVAGSFVGTGDQMPIPHRRKEVSCTRARGHTPSAFAAFCSAGSSAPCVAERGRDSAWPSVVNIQKRTRSAGSACMQKAFSANPAAGAHYRVESPHTACFHVTCTPEINSRCSVDCPLAHGCRDCVRIRRHPVKQPQASVCSVIHQEVDANVNLRPPHVERRQHLSVPSAAAQPGDDLKSLFDERELECEVPPGAMDNVLLPHSRRLDNPVVKPAPGEDGLDPGRMDAVFDGGLEVPQLVRASQTYRNWPWFDFVLYTAAEQIRVGEVRAIVHRNDGDVAIVRRLVAVNAQPGCPLTARGFQRLA